MNKILAFFHIHKFKTTHTNRWMHPTKQKCRCGLTRSIKIKEGRGCMTDRSYWEDEKGNTYKWNILE